jgi:hypothetical protein
MSAESTILAAVAQSKGRRIPGTDDVIFKYFRQKIQQKMAFLTQNKAKLCKNLIITLVFEKNAHFLPKIVENRRKKIVIITSIPGLIYFLGYNIPKHEKYTK